MFAYHSGYHFGILDGLFKQFFDFCSVVATVVVILVVRGCRLADYLRVVSTTKGVGADAFSVCCVLCIWYYLGFCAVLLGLYISNCPAS